MAPERLQKMLARAGVASRRRAESLLAAGRVRVNGRTAQLGDSADPSVDRVEVDGRLIGEAESRVHLALHKPRGYLSSAASERGHPSVIELVPHRSERLWPAGRLDLDSEGLMLLTNDGPWAQRVMHPRYALEREYAVLVARAPDQGALAALRRGIALEDGVARLLAARRARPPAEIECTPEEQGVWLRVRIGEGRKREVRRLFGAVGHPVRRLVRVRLGPLALDGLRPGAWRALSLEEVDALAGDRPALGARDGHLAVAVDGPSGSGKSTVGSALAVRLGAAFVDTGLMYRALTLAAIERGVDPEDGPALGRLASRTAIRVRRPRAGEVGRLETVLIGRRDVTDQVRTPGIDRAVSAVSRHAEVRDAMLDLQRAEARRGPTVMVGRDIGTVVLPDATLKVYLSASTGVRAARRAGEMGRPDRADEYLREIKQRDAADSGREVAPLRKARGALVIDTGRLDVEACVSAIVQRLGSRASTARRAAR